MSLYHVEILLANEYVSVMDFYVSKDKNELVNNLMAAGKYESAYIFYADRNVFKDPTAVCEEAFDLTNNPCRQDERDQSYGRGRSLSVGDLVVVDGVSYLCDSMGWKEIVWV